MRPQPLRGLMSARTRTTVSRTTLCTFAADGGNGLVDGLIDLGLSETRRLLANRGEGVVQLLEPWRPGRPLSHLQGFDAQLPLREVTCRTVSAWIPSRWRNSAGIVIWPPRRGRIRRVGVCGWALLVAM